MIDLATGELAPLYGTASIACGNRREAVCPSCSAVYKRDARQLVRAGLAGGKGIPETITAHPCVFATLTAPSFGPVHARRPARQDRAAVPSPPRRQRAALPARPGHLLPDPARRGRSPARPADVPGLLRLRSRRAVQRLRGGPVAPVRHLPAPAPGPAGRGHPEDPRALSSASGSSRSPNTRRAAWSTSTPSSASTRPERTTSPRRPVHRRPAVRRHRPGRRRRPPRHRPRRPGRGARLRPADRPPDHPARRRAARHRPGAQRPGRRQLHRQVRHQDHQRPRPAQPAAPPRGRPRPAALLGPLPGDDHRRLAARRHPAHGTGSGPGRTCSATAATS